MNLSRLRSMYFVTVVVMALVILGLAAMVIDQSARITRLSETIEDTRTSIREKAEAEALAQEQAIDESETPEERLLMLLETRRFDDALALYKEEFHTDIAPSGRTARLAALTSYSFGFVDTDLEEYDKDGCAEGARCVVVEFFNGEPTALHLLAHTTHQFVWIELDEYQPNEWLTYTVFVAGDFATGIVREKHYKYFLDDREEAYLP